MSTTATSNDGVQLGAAAGAGLATEAEPFRAPLANLSEVELQPMLNACSVKLCHATQLFLNLTATLTNFIHVKFKCQASLDHL